MFSLWSVRYVLREDHPFCIKCYENVFANNCDECGKVIGIDSKVNVEEVDDIETVFDVSGSLLQREALAWELLQVQQVQDQLGGQAVWLQSWPHLLRLLLRRPVRRQVRGLQRRVQGGDEEDGVQDQTVAREVFCVLCLQEHNRNQILHPQGEWHLLHWMLWGQVRYKMH